MKILLILLGALFLKLLLSTSLQAQVLETATDSTQIKSDSSTVQSNEVEEEKKEEEKENTDPVTFSIGASFDFINRLSVTDLYYDVSFFKESLWGEEDNVKPFWKKIGIDAGVYQNRFFSTESRDISINQEFPISDPMNDSIRVVKSILVRTRTESQDNLGLYFSPTYQLKPNLYFTAHLEGIFQKLTTTFNDTISEADTMKIPIAEFEEPTPTDLLRPGKSEFVSQSVSTYVGGGFLLNLDLLKTEKHHVSFRFKPIIGYFIGRREGGSASKDMFYLIDFALSEKKTGFKLGGQVRGLFPMARQRNLPQFSLFLSKQFSLNKLYDLFSNN